MLKLLPAAVVLITSITLVSPCYCGYNGQEVKTVKGQIIDLDDQKNILVVKWFDSINLANDQITVFVPKDAIIYKGTNRIGFIELNQFDNITVDYYDDSPGPLIALKVSVVSQ